MYTIQFSSVFVSITWEKLKIALIKQREGKLGNSLYQRLFVIGQEVKQLTSEGNFLK